MIKPSIKTIQDTGHMTYETHSDIISQVSNKAEHMKQNIHKITTQTPMEVEKGKYNYNYDTGNRYLGRQAC